MTRKMAIAAGKYWSWHSHQAVGLQCPYPPPADAMPGCTMWEIKAGSADSRSWYVWFSGRWQRAHPDLARGSLQPMFGGLK